MEPITQMRMSPLAEETLRRAQVLHRAEEQRRQLQRRIETRLALLAIYDGDKRAAHWLERRFDERGLIVFREVRR